MKPFRTHGQFLEILNIVGFGHWIFYLNQAQTLIDILIL